MARLVRCLAALALVLSLAGWSEPHRLGAAPPDNGFTLASNFRGDRLVVWRADRGIKYSFSLGGGRFRKPQLIASPWAPAEYLQAALDDDGHAVIAWTARDGERNRLLAAITRPGAPTPVAQRVTPPDVNADEPRDPGFIPAERPQLAVSPAGRVALAWSEHFEASVRFGSTRRGFGPAEHVAPGFVMGVVLGGRRPRIALGASFPTMLVEYARLRAGVYRQGAVLGGDGVRFASDAGGTEFLMRYEGYGGPLVLSTGPSAGALKRQVLARGYDDFYDSLLDVAPTGAAVAAWPSYNYDSVNAVVREPGGDFSHPRVVYKAPKPPNGFPALPLYEVSAASGGGAAIAVVPSAYPDRARIVRVDRRGRVLERYAIRGGAVRRLHVLSDGLGTAAAWTTDKGLFVATR